MTNEKEYSWCRESCPGRVDVPTEALDSIVSYFGTRTKVQLRYRDTENPEWEVGRVNPLMTLKVPIEGNLTADQTKKLCSIVEHEELKAVAVGYGQQKRIFLINAFTIEDIVTLKRIINRLKLVLVKGPTGEEVTMKLFFYASSGITHGLDAISCGITGATK